MKKFSSSQIILLGFASVILMGSLLLMLPVASIQKESTSFLDALFTATSSVCVTGLIVKDTATYWSSFGQFIILLLIQIGGMGVVTIAIAIFTLSGKRLSFRQRSMMQDSISAHKVGGIVRLTSFILKSSLCIEMIGALCMMPVFVPEFGWKGIWYALFHSVSAFCNAGFDLMGIKSPFSSLTSYASNPIINITIMTLIVPLEEAKYYE